MATGDNRTYLDGYHAGQRAAQMKCEAIKYVDSYKLHGCYETTCKDCGAKYCPHWPKCPRCMIKALDA